MIVAIADTHTAIWYLFNDARLSAAAGEFIENAAAAGGRSGYPPSVWLRSST